MKINIKPNLRQFLTDKIKIQDKNIKNVSVSNQNNNFIKQINSHTNSNKNIGKFSLLNSIKDKDNKKVSKLISTNNINNGNDNNKDTNTNANINVNTNSNTNVNINLNNNKNINYNFNNNNSFLKETQDTFNKFRKSKTTEKTNGNKNILKDYKENQNNKNKKIMIKQSNGGMKRYNLSINKIPKYDNSSFNQVIKYYTLKSESKTIQIEELSTYLRPIRNILGFANKIKTQNNITNSININNDYACKTKNYIYNDNNSINSNKEDNNDKNEDKNLNIIEKNDNKEETNINNNNKEIENGNNLTFGKQNNIQSSTNLINGNKYDLNNKNIFNNQINTALIKNCVFNNISHTQRNTKFSPIPFNIKIDKINNINNINNIKNIINTNITNSENNRDTNTNNNLNNNKNINNKDISEIDTQISTNNNNINHENKGQDSQAFNQFRPRKMNLPKNGINLSSMQFKNKILQNILNKRKQNK